MFRISNPLIRNTVIKMGSDGLWGFQTAMIAPATFFAVSRIVISVAVPFGH
ncbi:MAG: hypothetical protein WCL16_02030 [bacterium]